MRKTLLAAALVLLLPGAHAADAVTDAMQAAYPSYRLALFKTNTGTPDDALASVQKAQQAWLGLSQQFGGTPPAPYDRDAAFAATLQEVNRIYAAAAEQARAGQLPQAHETLEAIRKLVADLRQRNQVSVYSDHMNAYHAVMEQLLEEGKRMLGEADGVQRLTLKAGALFYLSEQLESQAPQAYRDNPEFGQLIKAQRGAIEALRAALLRQDKPAMAMAIGKLKMPYSKLFVKFG